MEDTTKKSISGKEERDGSVKPPLELRPMPLLYMTSPATVQKCAELELRPTDVFICSYPKSGTTWMQHICLSLLLSTNKDKEELPYQHVSDYAPFFEIDPHWQNDTDEAQLTSKIQENHSRLGRRVLNTHLRFDMLPRNKPAKFIYIIRSPLDTCVSFFHHMSNQMEGGYEGTLDDFYQEWTQGDIAFGSWSDHVLSYAQGAFATRSPPANHDDNCASGNVRRLEDGRHFLLVSYEEMKKDLAKVVSSLVDFLELNVTSEQQQELLPSFTFASMKADISRFQPQSVAWKNNFCFLRKGSTGDFSETLSEEQKQAFPKDKFKSIATDLLKDSNPAALATIIGSLEAGK